MSPPDRKQVAFPLGRVAEVFGAFLALGLTSFGGPIAHLGYFHRELVVRRRWVDEATYAELLALAQILPGPASSQLGFALGRVRAGWAGAMAAFIAFTLPSAILLFLFARALPLFEHPVGRAVIHGLKLVAVVVVAQGVVAMARRLTPDLRRLLIAGIAAALVLFVRTGVAQLIIVALGAVLGLALCRSAQPIQPAAPAVGLATPHAIRNGLLLIGLFALLLVAAVVGQSESPLLAMAAAVYRAGALVFGGGHVVLPLLNQAVVVPGWVSPEDFLAGYGAAQAVPGPLFSIAAFLGARMSGAVGAVVALIAIFLPGFLLMAGTLPLWGSIARRAHALSAFAGINAAVVGVLAAALYDPIWTGAIHSSVDIAIIVPAFIALLMTRASVLWAIAWCVLVPLLRVYFARGIEV